MHIMICRSISHFFQRFSNFAAVVPNYDLDVISPINWEGGLYTVQICIEYKIVNGNYICLDNHELTLNSLQGSIPHQKAETCSFLKCDIIMCVIYHKIKK